MLGCGAGVAAALVGRSVGWIPKSDIWWTIGVALVPYAAIAVVVIVINAIRSPVNLEKERDLAHAGEISAARGAVQRLEAENKTFKRALTKHPEDAYKEEEVRGWLAQFTADET